MSTATLAAGERVASPRIEYTKISPEPVKALMGLERVLRTSPLGPRLLDLIKLRASQINGCAYCIDMHWKELRAEGETEQRLYGLDAWRESPYYTPRERAALEWTEAVTRISETHADDPAFEAVRAEFSEHELVDLTWAIAAINAWNRVAISFRAVPGQYQPSAHVH
jgi:AhpD family alkylhydroperoxidase